MDLRLVITSYDSQAAESKSDLIHFDGPENSGPFSFYKFFYI
jgi:hypothetical protein